MFDMKEEYMTGIGMIDKEHKKLFDLADEAHQLQKEEFLSDKYADIDFKFCSSSDLDITSLENCQLVFTKYKPEDYGFAGYAERGVYYNFDK